MFTPECYRRWYSHPFPIDFNNFLAPYCHLTRRESQELSASVISHLIEAMKFQSQIFYSEAPTTRRQMPTSDVCMYATMPGDSSSSNATRCKQEMDYHEMTEENPLTIQWPCPSWPSPPAPSVETGAQHWPSSPHSSPQSNKHASGASFLKLAVLLPLLLLGHGAPPAAPS